MKRIPRLAPHLRNAPSFPQSVSTTVSATTIVAAAILLANHAVAALADTGADQAPQAAQETPAGLVPKDSPYLETTIEGVPCTSELEVLERTRTQMVEYGIDFLRNAQEDNGGFTTEKGIGPSIIVAIGLLHSGLPTDDPMLAQVLAYILRAVQVDGGIYTPNSHISVYESCLALTCLSLARQVSGSDEYNEILENGEKFIRGEQYSEENGTDRNDKRYGGLGYGKNSRPDLSNTQFFVETLRDLGADFDDQAVQDAVVFVSRCQNFAPGDVGETEGKEEKNDGGFIYTCLTKENPAGQEASGGLRSYGSITYAGLKSLIYAGLSESDPRVEAASGWIRENYSTTKNPGLGQRGLYYYYHTMSKTLDILGNQLFADSEGRNHFWRGELIKVFAERQRMDGSWVNDNPMWYESDPNLVTGYALIVLSYCEPGGKETAQ